MTQGYRHASLRRCTANEDVFSSDMVYAPVNRRRIHWVLVVLEWRKGIVAVFDYLWTSREAGEPVLK